MESGAHLADLLDLHAALADDRAALRGRHDQAQRHRRYRHAFASARLHVVLRARAHTRAAAARTSRHPRALYSLLFCTLYECTSVRVQVWIQ